MSRCKAVLSVHGSFRYRAGMRCPDRVLPGSKSGLCWLHAAAEQAGSKVRRFPFKNPDLAVKP